MNTKAPYNKEEIEFFVDREYEAQKKMNAWYHSRGYEIVNRNGDKVRDLELKINGKIMKVEEKYRSNDYGDFLVELIQCVMDQKMGWFYTENPDRLAYVICNYDWMPSKVYWIKFNKFKDWLFDYLRHNNHPKTIISTKGMGLTLNIAVPWSYIPDTICKEMVILQGVKNGE